MISAASIAARRPGADREAHVGRGQRRCIVDTVTDHARDASFGAKCTTRRPPCPPAIRPRETSSMPAALRDRVGCRRVVAGDHAQRESLPRAGGRSRPASSRDTRSASAMIPSNRAITSRRRRSLRPTSRYAKASMSGGMTMPSTGRERKRSDCADRSPMRRAHPCRAPPHNRRRAGMSMLRFARRC